MAVNRRFGAFQLARRTLWQDRAQTLLLIIVGALISGTVVFAAGYQRQVQQAIADVTFAIDGPGNSWRLTGTAQQADLRSMLPSETEELFEEPVPGSTVRSSWSSTKFSRPVQGSLAWREGLCDHVVMVMGRCPSSKAEVIIAADDSVAYRTMPGDVVVIGATGGEPREATVSGVYRVRDITDSYWFGLPPVGGSGFDADGVPHANSLFATPDLILGFQVQHSLDFRLDKQALELADLPTLATATSELSAQAGQHQARLITSIPDSLDRIAGEQSRARAGLALMLTQLAALVVVVVGLLVSVTLSAQRTELGLARLRGEPTALLRREVLGRWTAALGLGWVLGWLPGLGLLTVMSSRLPGHRTVSASAVLIAAPMLTLLLLLAAVLPAGRQLLAQPVVALLRAVPPSARGRERSDLLVDLLAVVVGIGGVVVAMQVGTDSVVGLLVPAFAAIAIAIGLHRGIGAIAAVVRKRWLRRPGSSNVLLTAVLMLRLRGFRIMIVTVCLATAVATFGIQLMLIGGSARRHIAEVRTGAESVLTVSGDPGTVLAALDEIDPGRASGEAGSSVVVTTRRVDAAAVRGMFVEPAIFAQQALGAGSTADQAGWQAISAPSIDPIELRGDQIELTVGEHEDLRATVQGGGTASDAGQDRTGTTARARLDLLTAQNRPLSIELGRISLAPGPSQVLRRPVDCATGCRLVRIVISPNGPMDGALPLSGLRTLHGDNPVDIDLGPPDAWQPLPLVDPNTAVASSSGTGGPELTIRTSGTPGGIQHAWLPGVLPVLDASGGRLGINPTIAAPDGSPLPIRPVGTANDAVPRELTGVAVGDLTSVLRSGPMGLGDRTSVQVWLFDPTLEPQITRGLLDHGIKITGTDQLSAAVEAQRSTAAALTAQVIPGFVGIAGVFAALGLTLIMAGQRGVLARDLAGLAIAGTRRRTLRRSVLVTYLGPALIAILAGVAAGALGCALVVDGLPLVPDAPPVIGIDRGLHRGALVWCLAGSALIVGIAVLFGLHRLGQAGDGRREATMRAAEASGRTADE